MGICGVGCSGYVEGEAVPGSDALWYPQYQAQTRLGVGVRW